MATFALVLAAGCVLRPTEEESPVPDGGCPAGQDCGGGLLPDAGCPIGQVCPACDAGLVLVAGACVSPVQDAGPGVQDAGPNPGPQDSGVNDAGPGPGPGPGPVDAGPPGTLCLTGKLSDAESNDAVSGATVAALDLNGNPIAGASVTSASDGSFSLCPPPGVTFTTQITASTYPVTYLESAQLVTTEDVGTLPLISNTLLPLLGEFISGAIPGDALILAPVQSLSGSCSAGGWSIGATLPSGAPLSFGVIYIGTEGTPQTGLSATTSQGGAAILYNIDPTVTSQVAVAATNPAPAGCSPENGTVGFTGQVQVAAGALSIAPIVIP